MAIELIQVCWLIDFPSAPMRWTMTKLCDCADRNGANIFPSVNTICEETSLKPTSVREAIAAFEQCGLLAVKENRYGSKSGRTTVLRELNVDLLRLIAGKRNKGKPKSPSTHLLVLVEVVVMAGERIVRHPDAVTPSIIGKPSDQMRKMAVWAIVPRLDTPTNSSPKGSAILPSGGAVGRTSARSPGGVANDDSTPPAHEWPGTRFASATRAPPLRSMKATTPPDEANPFIEPSIEPALQPPGCEVLAKANKTDEVEEALRAVLSEKLDDAERCFAITSVLRPIATLRRLDALSLIGALRSLADWLAPKTLSATEAKRVVEQLLATRRATVKPSDLQEQVKIVLSLRPQLPILAGDSELMRYWPDVLARLDRAIGADRTAAWFSTIVIASVRGGTVLLVTHLPHVARYIENEFCAQLRDALVGLFPNVERVVVSARRAAA